MRTGSINFSEITALHAEGAESCDAGRGCSKWVTSGQWQCYGAQGKGISVLSEGQCSGVKGPLDDACGSSDSYLISSAIYLASLMPPYFYVCAMALELFSKGIAYLVRRVSKPVSVKLEERVPRWAFHYDIFWESRTDGVCCSVDQFPVWSILVKGYEGGSSCLVGAC